MYRRLSCLTFALVAGLCSTVARAGDLLVPQSHATIQAALDAAPHGSTIVVASGTYRENPLIEKAVSLRSASGAASTIIDGGALGPVVVARGSGSEAVTIAGFTMRNGANSFGLVTSRARASAGGVHLESVHATVVDNVISGNVGCVGLGVSTLSASVNLRRNQIKDNVQDPSCSGADGGGVFVRGDGTRPSVVAHNLISGNRIGGRGAGVAAQAVSAISIASNKIMHNVAGSESAGGILINMASADIVGNVISHNSAGYGGGMAILAVDRDHRVRVSGNVFYGNQAVEGSAASLVTYYEGSLRFIDNVVTGKSAGSLVYCEGLPYTIPKRTTLSNPLGPELGGTCLSGPGSR